jgi:hypothetical protein
MYESDKLKESNVGKSRSTHVRVRNAYKVLDGNLREADHSEDLRADGKMLLR